MNFKFFLLIALFSTLFANANLTTQDHSTHPPHNMILFGSLPIFASHIVYKKPHNYQVILEVSLDSTARQLYHETILKFPNDQMILLLDSMDIGQIERKPSLTAKLIRTTEQGERKILDEHITIKPEDYKIIFFDEIPLNLNP